VSDGVLGPVGSSDVENVALSLINLEVLVEDNSLLSVVSESLETDELDGESLELRLSAWQPGEWGSWVESSELQAQLHSWLPWENPVTVVHVVLLNWSVDPLSDGSELELLLLVSLVKGESEVFSVEESQRLSSLVPHESLGLILRVKWLGNNLNLFFIVLNRSSLSEGVLWSMLTSNHDHSSVKSINVLNWWHAFNWNWSCALLIGSLLSSSSLRGSLLGSFLVLALLSFSWRQSLVLVMLVISFLGMFVRLSGLMVMVVS